MFRELSAIFALAVLSWAAQPVVAEDIVETAVESGKFRTLVAAVKAADLVDTLQGDGPYTVFAPTDNAFNQLPEGTVETLLREENKDQLTQILNFHVVPGRVLAKDAFGLSQASTVNGQRIDIRKDDGRLRFNGSRLVQADIECDNGIIHVIDAVMLPESKSIPQIASEAGQFNTLLTALKAAELADVLGTKGPFTVFAPTDEAFEQLPRHLLEDLLKPENKSRLVSILKYHVASGRMFSDELLSEGRSPSLLGPQVNVSISAEGLRANESRIVATDLEASNGVIHVIDSVLLPPELSADEAQETLQKAVRKGAPKFNHGSYRECADIYARAMNRVIDEAGSDIPAATKELLRISIRRANSIHQPSEKCWTLRHGIDLAYFSLEEAKHVTR